MKRIVTSLLILGVALLLVPSFAPGKTKAEGIRQFNEAKRLFNKARSSKDLRDAARKNRSALKIFNEVGFDRGRANALTYLGRVYFILGDYKKAAENYRESLAICSDLGYDKGEGKNLDGLGLIYADWGNYSKARAYHRKARGLFVKLGYDRGEGSALLHLGMVYYQWGQYKKAKSFFEKSVAKFEELGYGRGEAEALNHLGQVYAALGKYDKAMAHFDKSLAISGKLGARRVEGGALNRIGYQHFCTGKYDEALGNYEKSLAMFRNLGYLRGEGRTLCWLGEVYRNRSQYDKAVKYFEKSLAICKKLGYKRGQSNSILGLAIINENRGKISKATAYYNESLSIDKKLGYRRGEWTNLVNLGNVNFEWGQYREAVKYYDKALIICKELGNPRHEASNLNNLANVYLGWGQYKKSVEFYEKALAIARKLGVKKSEANTLGNLGVVYRNWGQYEEAAKYYEESLAIYKKLGDLDGEATALTNLGTMHVRSGDYRGALQNYRKAVRMLNRIGVPSNWPKDLMGRLYLEKGETRKAEPLIKEAGYWTSLGWLYLTKADYDKAKQYYEGILQSAEKNKDVDYLFTAYTGLGKVSEAQEDYEKAEEYYSKGVELTEEMRSALQPAQRKNFLAVRVNGFYRSEPGKGLTRVRLKLNKAAGSIDSSEVTKARAFSDGIAQRSGKGYSGVPKEILDQESDLVNRLAQIKQSRNRINREKNSERWHNLSEEIRKVEKRLTRFVDMLWRDYEAYAAVKYPRPVKLMNSAVRNDEYLLLFDVVGEGVGVKLIKGKEILSTFYVKWDEKDLTKHIKRFRAPFDQIQLATFNTAVAKKLYKRLLLKALVDVPSGTPITIVPDGILATIPFEALVVEGTPKWEESENEHGYYPAGLLYVGDVYPISYYQSITALTLARRLNQKDEVGERMLIMADPVFSEEDDRLKPNPGVPANKPGGPRNPQLMSLEAAIGVENLRVPGTGLLAKVLAERYAGTIDVHTGLKARKEMLFNRPLGMYGSMVFATHGYFGSGLPGIREPILLLTMVNQPKDQDGFLRMTEVMGLDLNAEVVALTACQTGVGKLVTGEGTMNMGRAFQYAGAQSVLMTLWHVDEASSVKLVDGFFKYLKEGKSKVQALYAARKDIRGQGYRHPFYWAPFILVGEVN
ncbi:tetratricopeptide repeat protein [Thermodesulfobacteriota bacterium]